MTTKAILAAQVLDLLDKGKYVSKESAFNRQYVIRLIGSVYNSMVRFNYYEQLKMDGEYEFPDALFKVYEDTVVKRNERRNLLYIDLPGALVSVPASKCLKIGQMEDESAEFKMMYKNAISAWGKLESAAMNGYISYYLEERKAVFTGMETDWEGQPVLVKMIVNMENADEDETIPMPEDWETEIIDRVVRMYVPQHNLEENLANDNR